MRRIRSRVSPIGCVFRCVAPLLLVGVSAAAQTTTIVSVSSSGAQGNSESYDPFISADGRYVVFESVATNFAMGDTNGFSDVFVRDRQMGQTTRVSVSTAGAQGNQWSGGASISTDGRFVAFGSGASNLVAGDTNNRFDCFVRDRALNTTKRVSVSSGGAQGNFDSFWCSVSADGSVVVFSSFANTLVPDDTNGATDVFIHDLSTNQTTRVSVASDGAQSNGHAGLARVSADGRFVAFASEASNLVPGDTNSTSDVFVHDRQTGQTTCVSVSSDGVLGNGRSEHPSISANGRFVAFESSASNLVPGDTNNVSDVFVHDRQTGQTTRVSVSSMGAQANEGSSEPIISPDGRFVAFVSSAGTLVPGVTDDHDDIFVHDRATGTTVCVSVSSDGLPSDQHCGKAGITADGRSVVYYSPSETLVDNDVNGWGDIFLHALAAPCPGDTNGDDTVDFADFSAILAQYGQTGAGLSGDLNGDFVVNFADFSLALSNYGVTCE